MEGVSSEKSSGMKTFSAVSQQGVFVILFRAREENYCLTNESLGVIERCCGRRGIKHMMLLGLRFMSGCFVS